MTPWLSVIVPVYNGERYLAAALESVSEQDDGGIEVIAIDDGSTDGSVAVLESYSERLPLRIVTGERTGNWVANTNLGLALAGSRYVAMLHQDDLWRPGRVAGTRKVLEADPEVDLLLSDAIFVDDRGAELGSWTCPLRGGVRLGGPEVRERLLVQNFVPLPSATFKREAALRAGGLDEGLWYTADWDLWLKLAAAGATRYVPEAWGCFRLHEGSQTATRSVETGDFRRQLETVLDRHLDSWNRRPGPSPEDAEIERAARFSIELNVALAALSHGNVMPAAALAKPFLALGLRGWRRYVKDSRVAERMGSRLRARLRASSSNPNPPWQAAPQEQ